MKSLRQQLLASAYRKRHIAKRLVGFIRKGLPHGLSRQVSLAVEKIAFRWVPAYQGDTLPPIFHYWSNKYVRPVFRKHGFESPEDFYLKQLLQAASEVGGRTLRVASFGSGSASLELELLEALHARGIDATMLCVDLNEKLMATAKRSAAERGLSGFAFALADCNRTLPPGPFDVVIVNQFFHHIENLERFCALLRERLADGGVLVSSDMIGRNGHALWPSVETVVQAAWNRLPLAQRFDRYYDRTMVTYRSTDHSAYSNEGVRAQDVIGQLVEHFEFDLFITYGAALMPFVERRIGFNFDPDNEGDRELIDAIAQEDGRNLSVAGYPASSMLAAMRKKGQGRAAVYEPVSPHAHIELTWRERGLACA